MKGVGLCFRGRHTTDIGDVKYNKVNMLQCRHNDTGGCTRKWLEPDEYVPAFAINIDKK